VKYDTVIGTIGNTHGVRSEKKPINIARPMYALKLLACADADAKSGTTRLPATGGGAGGASTTGAGSIGAATPAGFGASISMRAVRVSVAGGKQSLSLHVWYDMSIESCALPPGAVFETRTGTVTTSDVSCHSVSMLKFGSKARVGRGLVGVAPGPKTAVFFTVTASACGPPGGCVSEYTCQPPSISAVAVAVMTAPGFTGPAGDTFIDQCTGV